MILKYRNREIPIGCHGDFHATADHTDRSLANPTIKVAIYYFIGINQIGNFIEAQMVSRDELRIICREWGDLFAVRTSIFRQIYDDCFARSLITTKVNKPVLYFSFNDLGHP